MHKSLRFAALAALIAIPAASESSADPQVATAATGKGTIHFGKDGHGVGLFDFNVDFSKPQITGSVLFAGEDHHGYPDVIIRMTKIETASIEDRTFTCAGGGTRFDDEVYVNVIAWDGSGTEEADWLHIHCTDADGQEVFHAQGEVFIGDIFVGTDD